MTSATTNSSPQIKCWYESFRVHFINMGINLGYKKEELGDIISQFFLDLLEKNIDPRTINNPQAYLSTAFRRKLIDHHRASLKTPFVDEQIAVDEYTEPSILDSIEKEQTNKELISLIRRAYKKLPNRCQKVVYLKFYKGLTTEQIALQTGLSKRSVYNNLFEGVKLLRSELNQQLSGIPFSTLLSTLPLIGTFFIF